MTTWIILSLCAFFTVIAIVRPNYMWALLSSLSWFLLFWWTRTNPFTGFALGDFGDTILICICWGAIAFIIMFNVIKVRDQRETDADKEYGETHNGERRPRPNSTGIKESTDDYYGRMYRLTHPKK